MSDSTQSPSPPKSSDSGALSRLPTLGEIAGKAIGSLSEKLHIKSRDSALLINKGLTALGDLLPSLIDQGSVTAPVPKKDEPNRSEEDKPNPLESATGKFLGGLISDYVTPKLGIKGLPGEVVGSILKQTTTSVATGMLQGGALKLDINTVFDPGSLGGLISNYATRQLGIKGLPGEVVGSVLKDTSSTALTTLIQGKVSELGGEIGKLFASSTVVAHVGGVFGAFLANKILPINSPAGAVASAVANLVLTNALTCALGPVGFLVRSFISGFIGGGISKVLGGGKKNPEAVTDTGLDAEGRFTVLGSGSRHGESLLGTTQTMAALAVADINGYLDLIGGAIANREAISGLRYGAESGKKGRMTYFAGPDHNLKENRFATLDAALDYGVLKELRNTQIEGGNPYLKRGLYQSEAASRVGLEQDMTLALRYALYQGYKDSEPDELLDKARRENFSWDEVLKQAEAMALDMPHPADHYSRVNFLASRLGSEEAAEIIKGHAPGREAPKLSFDYKLDSDERYQVALREQLIKEGRIEAPSPSAARPLSDVALPETKEGEVADKQPASRAPLILSHEGDSPEAIMRFRDENLHKADFWKAAAPGAPETRVAMLAGAAAAIGLTRSPTENAQAGDLFDASRGIEVAGGNLWQNQATNALHLIGRSLADLDVGSRHDWTQVQETLKESAVASQSGLDAPESDHIYVTENALAYDEKITSTEDHVLEIDQDLLTANDLGNIGDYLIVKEVGNAVNGQVSLKNGRIAFTPDHDFNGEARFDYLVDDGHGGLSRATARIDFGAQHDKPVVTGELLNSYQNTTLSVSVSELLSNDMDIDRTGLSITGVEGATLDGDTIHFTPLPILAASPAFITT